MFQNAKISYEFHSIKGCFTCFKISLHKIEHFFEKINVKIKLFTSWDSVYLLHTFVIQMLAFGINFYRITEK